MKIFASIILLFFVLFLAAPTIVACLEKDKDNTSLCGNCGPSSSFEEIKHDIKYYTFNSFFEISFLNLKKASGVIIFENLSKHDLNYASIFIPPPNKL
ncbi:hypothetical protein [Flavobacterium sp. 5]|uniref:hypothetical protein n=1 Tax=Flavobacterium sp. 5 TaxID=2035199 RepID=UPI000C2C98BD|nr:hypothetical protein [Flavobacterium sp. 5]PKB15378.1 hypothetical protein CLU82_0449 [Flavobacterium sp. 5]